MRDESGEDPRFQIHGFWDVKGGVVIGGGVLIKTRGNHQLHCLHGVGGVMVAREAMSEVHDDGWRPQ